MKIEIEVPDLEAIYMSNYDGEELNGQDLKKIIADIAIEKFIDNLYDDYMNDQVYTTIVCHAKELVKTHSQDIIDAVIKNVTQDILKKRSIVNEMPKKSEIANISKEWQNYFMELIDKAIAKRFK